MKSNNIPCWPIERDIPMGAYRVAKVNGQLHILWTHNIIRDLSSSRTDFMLCNVNKPKDRLEQHVQICISPKKEE